MELPLPPLAPDHFSLASVLNEQNLEYIILGAKVRFPGLYNLLVPSAPRMLDAFYVASGCPKAEHLSAVIYQ